MKYLFGLSTLMLVSMTSAAEPKRLLWGDTHLHTTYSSDAFANNNLLATPDTAYRYARGIPAIHPYHRARVEIDTPLDFLVVSDHAEFLGVIRHVYFDGVDTSETGFLDTLKARMAQWILRRAIDNQTGRQLFVDVLPAPEEPREAAAVTLAGPGGNVGWLPPMPQVEIDTWDQITAAAERYNEPGVFTALIGWEWSSIPGGANLHRVVLTDANADTASGFQPFGLDDSPYPEDLWAWLEQTSSATGADFLAIPHNSNISKGFMFDTRTLRGDEFTQDYIARRSKWEKIAEITQIKGDSETHPDLSAEDEFADFELYPFYIQSKPTEYVAAEGDYLRSTLRRGLEMESKLGDNPYRLGFIGSTDAHTSLPSAEEGNFHGKLPPVGDTVDRLTGQFSNTVGDPQLEAVWQDPQFDPGQAAFYYARVLQIPTSRHSLYDRLARNKDAATGRPDTIQERAYTSPIWYRPDVAP